MASVFADWELKDGKCVCRLGTGRWQVCLPTGNWKMASVFADWELKDGKCVCRLGTGRWQVADWEIMPEEMNEEVYCSSTGKNKTSL